MHWGWFLVSGARSWTAGEILASPQQMSFIADWAPPRARGRYLSLYQATWSAGLRGQPGAVPAAPRAPWASGAFWGLMLLLGAPAAVLLVRLDRTADRPELLRGLSVRRPDPELLSAIAPEG